MQFFSFYPSPEVFHESLPGPSFSADPGPTNVPLPVQTAIAQPTVDHSGPGLSASLTFEVMEGMAAVFKTSAGRDLPGLGNRGVEALL